MEPIIKAKNKVLSLFEKYGILPSSTISPVPDTVSEQLQKTPGRVIRQAGQDVVNAAKVASPPATAYQLATQSSPNTPQSALQQFLTAIKPIGYFGMPVQTATLGAANIIPQLLQNTYNPERAVSDASSAIPIMAGLGNAVQASKLLIPMKQQYTSDKYLPFILDALKKAMK